MPLPLLAKFSAVAIFCFNLLLVLYNEVTVITVKLLLLLLHCCVRDCSGILFGFDFFFETKKIQRKARPAFSAGNAPIKNVILSVIVSWY